MSRSEGAAEMLEKKFVPDLANACLNNSSSCNETNANRAVAAMDACCQKTGQHYAKYDTQCR